MQVTIEIPATVPVKIRGIQTAWNLADARPEVLTEIVRRCAMYGFQRKANDSSAMGIVKPADGASEAEMEAYRKSCFENGKAFIADWLAGDFETERATRESDPVGVRIRQLAQATAAAKMGAKTKDNKEAFEAQVKVYMLNPKFRAQAEADVAAAQALANLMD